MNLKAKLTAIHRVARSGAVEAFGFLVKKWKAVARGFLKYLDLAILEMSAWKSLYVR